MKKLVKKIENSYQSQLYRATFIIARCTLIMVCLDVMATFIASAIVYFRVGILQYQVSFLIQTVKAAVTVGITLGIGVWLIAKIEEILKRCSPPPNS